MLQSFKLFLRELLFPGLSGHIPFVVSAAGSVTVLAAITVPICVPSSVAVAIRIPLPVPVWLSSISITITAFALLVPLLPLQIALFFSLQSLLLSLCSSFVPFLLSLELGLFSLLFLLLPLFTDYPLLLFLDSGFLLPELFTDPFALGTPSGGLGGIFGVCLRALDPFDFGCLFSDICAANLADTGFDGANINQLANDGFGLLVDSRALEGTIDEGGCFCLIEAEKLLGVALHLLLGNFKNRFRDLGFIILELA